MLLMNLRIGVALRAAFLSDLKVRPPNKRWIRHDDLNWELYVEENRG
jgi:hypothetical protein